MNPTIAYQTGQSLPPVLSKESPPVTASFLARRVEASGKPLAPTCAAMPVAADGDRLTPAQLARMLPSPPVACPLMQDEYLKDLLQDPEESMKFYQTEIQRRRQARATGAVYCFPPLMTTLANMRKLTGHILANRQFKTPLTGEDRAAFAAFDGYIARLLFQQAPYEQSVYLAFMMACMLEIVTARYVLQGLADRAPELSPVLTKLSPFSSFGIVQKGRGNIPLKPGDIALSRVLSCRWGGLNPHGMDEGLQLLGCCHYNQEIDAWLKDENLFLYPSFEPLDLKDFARFLHLPVYPLGMTGDYALMADGSLKTPLIFFDHDLVHVRTIETSLQRGGPEPLDNLAGRLSFRRLVMDTLPASLKPFRLDKALALVVFEFFHELGIDRARQFLDVDSFLRLLGYVNSLRREGADSYDPEDLDISDLQALLACLWVHRAYRFWIDHAGESLDGIATAFGEQFTREALPAALACWQFFARHQAALQACFVKRAEAEGGGPRNPEGPWMYKSQSPYSHWYPGPGGSLMVKRPEKITAWRRLLGGLGEYVDLAFLDALHSSSECQHIKQHLGSWPPAALK